MYIDNDDLLNELEVEFIESLLYGFQPSNYVDTKDHNALCFGYVVHLWHLVDEIRVILDSSPLSRDDFDSLHVHYTLYLVFSRLRAF